MRSPPHGKSQRDLPDPQSPYNPPGYEKDRGEGLQVPPPQEERRRDSPPQGNEDRFRQSASLNTTKGGRKEGGTGWEGGRATRTDPGSGNQTRPA